MGLDKHIFDVNGTCLEKYWGDESIKEFTIPNNITELGYEAFSNNSELEKVIFPATLNYYGNYTFSNCLNLREIVFLHNEKKLHLGSKIFKNCPKLKKVSFEDWETFWNYHYDTKGGPLSNGAKLYVNGERITKIIIPDNYIEIDNGIEILDGAKGITDISFSDGNKAVSFKFEYTRTLTKESNIDNTIFLKYSGLDKIFKITRDVDEIVSQAHDIRRICHNIIDFGPAVLSYVIDKIINDKKTINAIREAVYEKKRNHLEAEIAIKELRKWNNKYQDESNFLSYISTCLETEFTHDTWIQYLIDLYLTPVDLKKYYHDHGIIENGDGTLSIPPEYWKTNN